MVGSIRHRGPDEFGIYRDDRAGLVHARLSLIDLTTGQQPLSNEDQTLWIILNGELVNNIELRKGKGGQMARSAGLTVSAPPGPLAITNRLFARYRAASAT